MDKLLLVLGVLSLGLVGLAATGAKLEKDIIPTAAGPLEIAFLGHGSLMMAFGGKTVHVDPYGEVADYESLPKADLVLITHEHFDHLDEGALRAITKDGTTVVATKACLRQVPKAVAMANGDKRNVLGLDIEAVPAYNIAHKRPDGQPFHPKGSGNGYIVTFGDKRVYIAGDTENIPEMKALRGIDVAFLPMNLPYTMTPEMVADAAKAFRPKVLYPYHFGDTDASRLVALLKGEADIEVRIRNLR